ncbi:hypothetical protein GQ600_25471 [Phytophthora cactorum]|nr:hypothetical protein GQ600_25471 [Phytophthora cactorum]
MEQANALIQGTLVPVKDLALVRKTLECSFISTDALPVLHNISQADAPMWKSTTVVQIARKRKVQRQVKIVFPKNYLIQCLAGIRMYENRFQISTMQASWASLSRNSARLQRKI